MSETLGHLAARPPVCSPSGAALWPVAALHAVAAPTRRPSWPPATRCAIPRPFAVTVNLLEYRNAKQTDANTLTVYSKADPRRAASTAADPLRGPAARCQQADAEERQRPVVLRPVQPGQHPPVAAAAPAGAGVQRRRGHGQPGQGLQGRTAGRGRHRRRRTRGAPRLQAGAGRRVARRHLPPRGDVGGRSLVAPDQGPLLRRKRSPAEDRLLPQVPAATGPRAADRGGHHRRAGPRLGDRLRYSDYAWRDVPDAWFQRDYLPRFRPE
jgi:hypothetical protein